MGAAAVMGGAMDGLMTVNGSSGGQEQARRASTPGTTSNTGGGFSSIFNLKSVISAATKTALTPTTSASNFYVSPVAPEPIRVDLHSQSHPAAPQKSVQGLFARVVGAFGNSSSMFVD